MIVAVEYTLPVLCWVDTKTGGIQKVTEQNDEIEATGRLFDEDGNRLFIGGRAISTVVEIAEGNDWPAREAF